MIWAGLDGIKKHSALPQPVEINLFKADEKAVSGLAKLPETLADAKTLARSDGFITSHLPARILELYCAE